MGQPHTHSTVGQQSGDSVGRILIVDDERPLSLALQKLLCAMGHEVECASDGPSGLAQVKRGRPFDLIMLDHRMPGLSGLEVLEAIKGHDPKVSVLMMTGFATVETAVKAIKLGALDYLTKPFEDIFKVCGEVARHAIRQTRLARSAARQGQAVTAELARCGGTFEGMVGRSQGMKRLYEFISGVAPTDATVLVQGETGTGKELVAKGIHNRSPRRKNPFVPINCAALPESLLASELFGHKKGSFTGALWDKKGLFEAADGGTLFLDEVAEIPLELQAKLLRVLEEGEIRRVGEVASRRVDVRVVAASHRPLRDLCREGVFREDLYYRLAVVTIRVPPLRERLGDIPQLAQHFLHAFVARTDRDLKGFEVEALEALRLRSWEGNVRELRNVLERTFIFARSPTIAARDLPEETRDRMRTWSERAGLEAQASPLHFIAAKQQAMEAFEVRYLTELMERTEGNISRAAREAGMDRSNFRRLLKKLQIAS